MINIIDVHNNHVGVVYGKHIGGLSPAAQPIGADFILTINGSGLTDAVSVTFVPDDSIAVGIPIVANDGLSLTVSVAIDADADKTLRQVLVDTQDGPIIASPATADRFEVTDLQPLVISLSPNFLVTGDDFISLTIRGQMIQGVNSVFTVPGADIITDNLQVNAAATEVTVDIRATASAQIGSRVIVVETSGGESSNIPTPANTINIVSAEPTAFNALISPVLGIEKTVANPPLPPRNLLITSTLLGIVRETAPPPDTIVNRVQHATRVSVLQGAGVISSNPQLGAIGSSLLLTIAGVGLDQVTEFSLNPADDLLLPTGFNVNAEGTQLTAAIDVGIDAELTQREIVLTTTTGKLPFVNSDDSRLQITGLLPIIESIAPIQEFPGTNPTLVVRGFNLNNAVSIAVTPNNGDISFDTFSVNANGTEILVPMVISPSAVPGPRVITVTTLAGVTEDQATPANTFTVLPLP